MDFPLFIVYNTRYPANEASYIKEVLKWIILELFGLP